jgi:putative oxidoreductase
MNKIFSASPLWQQQGLAIIRIIVGLFLVYHGWEVFDAAKMKEYTTWNTWKDYPSPEFMVYLGKTSELAGGVLLTLGLFSRLACIIIAGTMLYIVFFVGNGKFWSNDQHPFLFVLIAFIFFFTGPGKWSLDQLIFGRNISKE